MPTLVKASNAFNYLLILPALLVALRQNGQPQRVEFDEAFGGQPIKVRFRWSEITASSARWEQALSPDSGAMWEVNWVMQFRRA